MSGKLLKLILVTELKMPPNIFFCCISCLQTFKLNVHAVGATELLNVRLKGKNRCQKSFIERANTSYDDKNDNKNNLCLLSECGTLVRVFLHVDFHYMLTSFI